MMFNDQKVLYLMFYLGIQTVTQEITPTSSQEFTTSLPK